LETTLTNENSIQEDIKSRLKSGNACYHSVENLLSSSFLFFIYLFIYLFCWLCISVYLS